MQKPSTHDASELFKQEAKMAESKAAGLSGCGSEEKKVIFASSLGTVFEWYDFYLYATLAPFFAALFFPPGNETAALMSAFATYAAGFLVRPFGAIVFGRIGDMVGRKYTFLVTIVFMGGATFLVGLLPTFASIGWAAPLLLVKLRLVQGLALGGEYGGAGPMLRSMRRMTSAVTTPALSRPRRRSAFSWRLRSSAVAGSGWMPKCLPNGAGAFRSCCQFSCWQCLSGFACRWKSRLPSKR